jgi:hypothetical protein
VFWGLNIPLTSELPKLLDPFWVSPARYLIASTLPPADRRFRWCGSGC